MMDVMMALQFHVMELTADNIGDAIAFLFNTDFTRTSFGIDRIIQTILCAVKLRARNIPILARFASALLKAATSENSLAELKSCALGESQRLLSVPKPFPNEAGLLSFLFHAFKHRFLTIDDIARLTRSLLEEPFAAQSTAWLLSYFAPELQLADPNLTEAVISRVNTSAGCDDWPDDLTPFADGIDDDRRSNWSQLKMDREALDNSVDVISWLRNDDVKSLKDFTAHPEVLVAYRVRPECRVPFIALFRSATLVQAAASLGAPNCFRFLLANGADLRERDENFTTLPQMAIIGGNLEIIRLCEQYHLDFTATLHTAVRYHRYEMFDWLFERSSQDTREFDEYGDSPIHAACVSNNLYALNKLVSAGGDINRVSWFRSWTPLINAARYNSLDATEFLLSLPVIDVHCQSQDGFTAAEIAVRYGSVQSLERLMAHGANDNLLHIAVQYHRTAMIRFLLTKDWIDPNKTARYGKTPLHRAIRTDHTAGVIALVADPRVNVNAITANGRTPLHMAIKHKNTAAFDAIMARPDIDLSHVATRINWTYLHFAHANSHMLRALLQRRAIDVNARDKIEMTVLHVAATSSDAEVAEVLILQPDIDINARDRCGMSALHRALWKSNTSFAQKLIECPRTDINICLYSGISPIRQAIARDLLGCVRALCRRPDLSLGASATKRETIARYPLELATFLRKVEIIETLLEYPGMKAKKKEHSIKQAIQLAKNMGFDDCLRVLKIGCRKNERQKTHILGKLRAKRMPWHF
jgi:ankyrin repeat protein